MARDIDAPVSGPDDAARAARRGHHPVADAQASRSPPQPATVMIRVPSTIAGGDVVGRQRDGVRARLLAFHGGSARADGRAPCEVGQREVVDAVAAIGSCRSPRTGQRESLIGSSSSVRQGVAARHEVARELDDLPQYGRVGVERTAPFRLAKGRCPQLQSGIPPASEGWSSSMGALTGGNSDEVRGCRRLPVESADRDTAIPHRIPRRLFPAGSAGRSCWFRPLRTGCR